MMILFTLLLGCASRIDSFTLDKVLPIGMGEPDLGKACALGESLNYPLRSLTNKTPNKAMIISETTAALCLDIKSMEEDLKAAQFKYLSSVPQAMDGKIAAQRMHTKVAIRYVQAYNYTESAFGTIGEGACPKLSKKDESAFLIGLIAGTLAVIHSRLGGSQAGVSDSLLPKIARASKCLDDEKWWYTPQALRSAVWAFVPGSGPENVDPWSVLYESGEEGAKTQVRVAWGIHNLIASISNQEDSFHKGIVAHAESINNHSISGPWALLDEYAFWVSRHRLDLLWMKKEGHRSPDFGSFPVDQTESPPLPVPFEEDPF